MSLHEITAAKTRLDERNAVAEFGKLARILTQARGVATTARQLAANTRATDRVVSILKADPGMVSAPGGSPESWGGAFLAYENLAAAFLASLVNADAFDAALPFMRRAPLKSRVLASSVAATGYVVAEADAKTIAELNLSSEALATIKAACVIVTSIDLLKLGGAVASQLFNTELRNGIAKATDLAFVSGLIAETTPTASGDDVMTDLATLLTAIDGDAQSKYFIAMEPDNAKRMVATPGVNGAAFPDMTPSGGTVCGISIVVSDALSSGQVLMFDAT